MHKIVDAPKEANASKTANVKRIALCPVAMWKDPRESIVSGDTGIWTRELLLTNSNLMHISSVQFKTWSDHALASDLTDICWFCSLAKQSMFVGSIVSIYENSLINIEEFMTVCYLLYCIRILLYWTSTIESLPVNISHSSSLLL